MAEDTAAAEAAAKEAEATAAAKEADDKAKADEGKTPEELAAEKEAAEAAAKEADEPAEFDATVWGDTGSEVGNSVLQVLSDSGVDVDVAKSLLFDAVQAGDPSSIDKDALIEKVGKANANLVMAGVENYVRDAKEATDKIITSIHDAAGGKEAWDTMSPWINKNVSAEDLAEYRPMLDAGGKQASFAVSELRALYNADPKNEKLGGRTLEGSNTKQVVEPGISRREYGDKLNVLHRTNKATPEARAVLKAARARGVAQGL